MEDARTKTKPFGVVCGVEDFALDLEMSANVEVMLVNHKPS